MTFEKVLGDSKIGSWINTSFQLNLLGVIPVGAQSYAFTVLDFQIQNIKKELTDIRFIQGGYFYHYSVLLNTGSGELHF